MLDAEERARQEADAPPRRITREEMDAADRQGLIDEAHLSVFVTWYQLGGMESKPTITEIAAMPAALRHDLIYLLSEFGRLRKSRERKKGKAK